MSDTSTGDSKVVVNRCMSLDGFIAAAGHVMDWGAGRQLADFVGPEEFHEIAAATGAMLVGRRTSDVGDRMEAEKPGSVDYPFSGPVFVLTHRPPEPPGPGITYLTGDIGEAVATARGAAGGKNLEILGADVAAQCLQAGPCRRDPGVRAAGAARRRHPLLAPGPPPDRPGADQQHAVGHRHHPPVPRPQVISACALRACPRALRAAPVRPDVRLRLRDTRPAVSEESTTADLVDLIGVLFDAEGCVNPKDRGPG